jgi:hypothetical protein
MLRKSRLTVALLFALLLTLMMTSVVSAHYCTNPNKPDGAGSIGTINIATGEETITKKNGGFITITDGETFSVDVFNHVLLPEGALNAGPGDNQCDGKGVDNALVCLGVEP